VLITEFKQRVLGPQEKPRMRRKGQCGRLPAKRARTRKSRANDGAVAAVNAIEIADGYHRTGQWAAVDALRAAARDVELFRGKGPAHRSSE